MNDNACSAASLRSRSHALLPQSLFGRFFAAVTGAVVLSSLVAVALHTWIARGILLGMQSEAGYQVLREASRMVAGNHHEIDDAHRMATEHRQEALRHVTELAAAALDIYRDEVAAGRLTLAQAKARAASQLSRMSYGDGDYLFAIDGAFLTTVHRVPERALVHQSGV